MNVTCTGCPAKYAVPDEKVRGKKVRITCKHCGTNIVVDGTAMGAGESDPTNKPATQPAVAATSAVPAAEPAYLVGFTDDRQETHTVSRIVELYGAGKIDDDALVWKDGMPDWLSPFDVPELAAAFRAKSVARRVSAPRFAGVIEDEATLIVRSPLEALQREAAAAAAAAEARPAPAPAAVAAPVSESEIQPTGPAEEKPAEESMFGKPAAARRVEKRAGVVDLFGGVANAGSEGDVSLDLGASDEPAQKLTGARNESSVLFSLDALTKSDTKAKKATDKESEQAASAALFGESEPDSLMNLGGAGLSALAAPDFTKPVSAVAPLQSSDALEQPSAPANKGRGGVVLMVGFLTIAAVAGVAFVMMKKQPAPESVPATPSAVTQTSSAAESNSADAAAASNAAAASAPSPSAPSPSTSASSSAALANGNAAAGPTAAGGAITPSAKPQNLAAAQQGAAAAQSVPAASAAVTKPAEPLAGAKKPDAPETSEAPAFDKNAAVAALGAAAASAGSCKTADGPTGSGKVSVTFAPSGRATATNVAGELAGTEVGGCVARLFRSAKVPPFSGDPVTVTKSFAIQ